MELSAGGLRLQLLAILWSVQLYLQLFYDLLKFHEMRCFYQ